MLKAIFLCVAIAGVTGSANAAEQQSVGGLRSSSIQLPGTRHHIGFDPAEFRNGARRPVQPLMTAILEWLAVNSELPTHQDPPNIRFASPYEIAATRYEFNVGVHRVQFVDLQPDLPASYKLLALYDEKSKTILLPETWTGKTAAELSLLVRETVHYVQDTKKVQYECVQARDRHAYAAQVKWLRLFGSDLESDFALTPELLKVATECTPFP